MVTARHGRVIMFSASIAAIFGKAEFYKNDISNLGENAVFSVSFGCVEALIGTIDIS